MPDDLPVVFALFMLVVGLAFVALPVAVVRSVLVDRRRERDWTPTTAVVRRVRTETRGGREHRRTVLVATYEYRDPAGAIQQGEGDLGRQGVVLDGSEQRIAVLVDPLDGSRSQVRTATGAGAVGCGVAVSLLFGLVGVVVAVTALTWLLG